MAKLLFNLRGVPDDEAEDVRQLLNENNIEYYETPAGKWGISSPGVWLRNKDDHPAVKKLLDQYQQKRFKEQREKYNQLKSEGKHKTIVDAFLEDPLKFIIYLAIICLILYFSVKPFLIVS